MRITVKLHSVLARYGREQETSMEMDAGTSISQLLQDMDIPQPEVGIILVNGRRAEPGHCLGDGDVLVLFPVIEGG